MTLNIDYFADGPWSHKTFDKLINDPETKISFICVRYDSEDKRLKEYAKRFKIDCLKYFNVNLDTIKTKDSFIKVIELDCNIKIGD